LDVKKWFFLASAAAVGVALLLGKDDIQRFIRMKNM